MYRGSPPRRSTPGARVLDPSPIRVRRTSSLGVAGRNVLRHGASGADGVAHARRDPYEQAESGGIRLRPGEGTPPVAVATASAARLDAQAVLVRSSPPKPPASSRRAAPAGSRERSHPRLSPSGADARGGAGGATAAAADAPSRRRLGIGTKRMRSAVDAMAEKAANPESRLPLPQSLLLRIFSYLPATPGSKIAALCCASRSLCVQLQRLRYAFLDLSHKHISLADLHRLSTIANVKELRLTVDCEVIGPGALARSLASVLSSSDAAARQGAAAMASIRMHNATAEFIRALEFVAPQLEGLELPALPGSEGDLAAPIAMLLRAAPALKQLDLRDSQQLGADAFIAISACTALEQLDVSGTRASQGWFANFGKPQLTDEAVAAIAVSCPNLREFSADGNMQLCDVGALAACTRLEKLSLRSAYKVPEDDFVRIVMECTRLEVLDLERTRLSSTILYAIADSHVGERLRVLNLDMAISSVDSSAVQACIAACRGLRSLNLEGARGIDDEAVGCIGESCKELVHLKLSHIDASTGVATLSRCKSLEDLHIKHSAVSRVFLLEVARRCKRLRLMCLNGCSSLTADDVSKLQAIRPHMTVFDMKGRAVMARSSRQGYSGALGSARRQKRPAAVKKASRGRKGK